VRHGEAACAASSCKADRPPQLSGSLRRSADSLASEAAYLAAIPAET